MTSIPMLSVSRRVATDTATLVVFDPAALLDKVDEECDWWTGDGDLVREEAVGTLCFIDTGSDGVYDLQVRVNGPLFSGPQLKQSELSVPSGKLLFGAAEYLPGEGEAIAEYLGETAVIAGRYRVRVSRIAGSSDASGSYGVHLEAIDAA